MDCGDRAVDDLSFQVRCGEIYALRPPGDPSADTLVVAGASAVKFRSCVAMVHAR